MDTNTSTQKIPYNLFQTWETKNISEDLQQIVNTWKINNPEYNHSLYDSKEREEFIKNNFNSSVYNAYCKIIPGAFKADLWRYCILYMYGGVYIDIYTLCLGSISNFLNKDIDFMVPIDLNTNIYEGTHNLFNAFIASIPQHKILYFCINYIVQLIENNIIPSSKLDFSGPGCLGRCTNIYLNLSENSPFVGKEGIHNNIHFLKFEMGNEYIKDIHNNILFQNKNGNSDIVNIYNNEISKINHISWLHENPFIINTVVIGSSDENIKIIKLDKKLLIGHNILNTESSNYKCSFDIKINNSELIIKRLDLNSGWDDKIILPIKYNKILVYNGFPFHYEMVGFILDFCNKYNIEVTVVLKIMDYSWINVYKSKYDFTILESLPSDLDHYLFVFILTDDDTTFPDNLINENTVCINHFYKNRRPLIKYQIQIAPFYENIHLYSLPVFTYINHNDKINIIRKKIRPIISFVGYHSLPDDMNSINIDNINDFDIYIINRVIPKNYIQLPNVFLFENISTDKLFTLLLESTYIYNYEFQKNFNSISASVPLSFTTGCKLILPKNVNNYFKFTSIIEYSYETKIKLDKTPSLMETFIEREKLLAIRDNSIFDLPHMKLFLQWKYS